MRQRGLTIRTDIIWIWRERFPWSQNNRRAIFRQSFISTGTGAFFFGATGAAVCSDGSLFGGTGEVVGSNDSLFVGTDEVVSSDGSLFNGTDSATGFDVFGATGTDVSFVGRGRGNGVTDRAGNEPSRCRLPSVPMTRVNQLETSCAISDRGDRPSVRAWDGACAYTDAGPRVRKNIAIATVFKRVTRTTFFVKLPNGTDTSKLSTFLA